VRRKGSEGEARWVEEGREVVEGAAVFVAQRGRSEVEYKIVDGYSDPKRKVGHLGSWIGVVGDVDEGEGSKSREGEEGSDSS